MMMKYIEGGDAANMLKNMRTFPHVMARYASHQKEVMVVITHH